MDTHQTARNSPDTPAIAGTAATVSANVLTRADVDRIPPAVHINEAADIAGVCRRTIYNWIAAKRVQVRYLPSGAQLVLVSSLILDERPVGVGTQQPPNSRAPRAAVAVGA